MQSFPSMLTALFRQMFRECLACSGCTPSQYTTTDSAELSDDLGIDDGLTRHDERVATHDELKEWNGSLGGGGG